MSLENLFNSLQNLFSGGQDQPQEEEKQSEGLMSSSLRPRARPEGVNVSLRPRARPEGVETDDKPNEYLAKTINSINDPDFNDDPEATPAGIPLNSINAQDVLFDPSTLHSVYNTRMAKAGANFSVSKQKPKSDAISEAIAYAQEKSELNKIVQETMMALNKTRPPVQVDAPASLSTKSGAPLVYSTEDAQRNLNMLGYDLEVDGKLGPKTRAAVRDFQEKQGIGVDGVVGPITSEAMSKSLEAQRNVSITMTELEGESLMPKPGTPDLVKSGIFSFKLPQSKILSLATSTPAKLLIKNIFGLDRNQLMGNIPITIDETSFKEDELEHFRNMWNKYGAGKIKKGQQIDSANDVMNVITGKDRAPFDLPADVRAYYSVGDFTLTQNEDGEVILKDQYDYNIYTDYTAEPITNKDGEQEYPRLSTEEFENKYSTARGIKDTLKAYTDGKIGFMSATHNLGFLLGSRDYKDSSKDTGTPILINLGKPETWDTPKEGEPTEGLMSPVLRPRARPEGLESTAIPEGQELKVNNLTIVNGSREDFPASKNMFNISLDYNSYEGPGKASGTEVIIPDNADAATRKAADEFNKAIVAFAKKHGIKGYKNRGVFTTSENAKRKGGEEGGVSNTVHAEPFFIQDKKMVAAVQNNFKEFSQIYVNTFGSLPARMIAPHKKGATGKSSEEFGSELEFGKSIIATLMGN